MSKRLSVSVSIDSRWYKLMSDVKAHPVWNLEPSFQPKVHMRRKSDGGFSFTVHNSNSDIHIYQTRTASTEKSWDAEETSSEVLECLDHAYELSIFAMAIIAERQESDPECCLQDDDPSLYPWSMLVPAPLRQMVDLGMAKIEYGEIQFENTGPDDDYILTFQENAVTHHVVRTFGIITPKYRYLYGESVHYIRIYNCNLPVIAQSAIKRCALNKVVDEKIFHHKGLYVRNVEAKGPDLMLHLGRHLYPSGRPPE